MEITCYILYVRGKAKKQKAKAICHGKFNLFVKCKFSKKIFVINDST
mgnify:CR=1 FL=1